MSDYIKQLEDANANLQEKLTRLEDRKAIRWQSVAPIHNLKTFVLGIIGDKIVGHYFWDDKENCYVFDFAHTLEILGFMHRIQITRTNNKHNHQQAMYAADASTM
jgi:hypothetical protein